MFLSFFSCLVIISIHDVLGATIDEKQKCHTGEQSNERKKNNLIHFSNKFSGLICSSLLWSHVYYNSKIKQLRWLLIHKSPDWGFCVSLCFLALERCLNWFYSWIEIINVLFVQACTSSKQTDYSPENNDE